MLEAPSPISPGQTGNAGLTLPAKAPYARVKQFLKDELSKGRWPPGTVMPSDAELVARLLQRYARLETIQSNDALILTRLFTTH